MSGRAHAITRNHGCELRPGVTLVELLIVIMIIGLLAAAGLKAYDTSLQAGRFQTTMRTLNELAYAIVGNPDLVQAGVRIDYGYVADIGKLPEQLMDLVQAPSGIDPTLWRGPYVTNRLVENPRGFTYDAWGDSFIYRADSLTISSRRGVSWLLPDSWITRKLARNSGELLRNTVAGVVQDAKGNVPGGDSTMSVKAALTYPFFGYLQYDTVAVDSNGGFRFDSRVPIGNRTVSVVVKDTVLPDTFTVIATKNVSVTPGGRNWVEVRLPMALWH